MRRILARFLPWLYDDTTIDAHVERLTGGIRQYFDAP